MRKFVTAFLLGTLIPIISFSQQIKTYKLQPYKSIEVVGRFDIELKKGSEYKLELKSENVDLSKVEVVNEKGKLSISCGRRNFDKKAKVHVTLEFDTIQSIYLTNEAQIYYPKALITDSISITLLNSANVTSKLECRSLNASLDNGATLDLEGKASKLNIEAASGGIFNGFEFVCDSINAQSTTGAMVKVNVAKYLKAYASARGEIVYRGKPIIDKKTSLGGKVEQMVE